MADRGRRRRLRIWASGLAPLAVIAAVVTGIALHGRAWGAGAIDRSRPGPVLLVSGYGGSTGSLDVLAARLRSVGRDVVVVPPVGDNTGDLTVQARALDDAVARRIVTLGSPHHGTDVAGLAAGVLPGACPTACRQLAPGSDLLSGLPPAPSGPAWTSIWTSDDDVVTPADSAVLAGALDVELQQVCPDDRVAHSGLPTDPAVIGLVELALDGPVPVAVPAASRCGPLRAAGAG